MFALIDIDGNGTWDISSYSATLNVILGPAPSITPSPTSDPNADSDGDGFKDSLEVYMGTNPNLSCGVNAWPPDFDNSRQVDISDVLAVAQHNGTSDRRYDLNRDGKVDTADVGIVQSTFYGKTCQ